MDFILTSGMEITGGLIIQATSGSPSPSPYVFQGSNYGYASGGGILPGVTNIASVASVAPPP